MLQHSEYTLAKKIRTSKGELLLTTTQESGAGGPLVINLPKFGEGSRLENWRKLMVPGRQIRLYSEYRDDGPHPALAFLKVTPEDVLVWDNHPVYITEWMPFWDSHRYRVELDAWNEAQLKAIEQDDEAVTTTSGVIAVGTRFFI